MEKKLKSKIAARSEVEKKLSELDRTFTALHADYVKKREMLVVELCKLDGAIDAIKELIAVQEDSETNKG